MNWLFYALLAPAVYAAVNFVDKYLIESEVKDYTAMPIYMGIVGGIAGLVLFILLGMPMLPLQDTVLVLSTGIISSFALVLYFKALSMEEATHINILFQTFPVITLVLSFVFLDERITLLQFIGFMLILSSAIAISKQKGDHFFELSPAFFLILLHNFLWAFSGVLMKFALNVSSFSQVISYESFGIALGALILYIGTPSIKKAFHKTNASLTRKAQLVIFINESLSISAKALSFFAFSIGPLTLVSVIEGTQTFIAIGYGLLLGTFFPKIFKDEAHIPEIPKKLFCATLALIGLYLLS